NNALGFAFKLAIDTVSPEIGKVMDEFSQKAQLLNQMNISSCETAQALDKLDKLSDKKSYTADVPEWVLPPKENVYNQMEALIWHFKIVMGETNVPMGEVYHCVEGANGELGFYLVSDGGRTPARLHFRRPCFIYYQAYPEMIKGTMLSDAILTMSSMNVIAGELDA
ncbi:MAG TPA: conjugal transfer protein TraH, partial [Flavobacteriales bacterium]|nr:conjugal transfer protein TraH [Flavobacteriales bacterium]